MPVIAVGAIQSPAGERAVRWAGEHALGTGSSVVLYSAVGAGTGAAAEREILDASLDAARQFLTEQVEQLRGRGLEADWRLERGTPLDVLTTASESSALLVIGSDRSNEKSSYRGQLGTRIVAASQAPAVVVPDVDLLSRAGVVVGADGSDSSAKALRFGAEEAHRRGEPLTAVTAWTPVPLPRHVRSYPREYLENTEEALLEALGTYLQPIREEFPDLSVVELVRRGDPAQVINAEARTARLVVLGSHGRGAIARFLLGSVSHETLEHLQTVTAVIR